MRISPGPELTALEDKQIRELRGSGRGSAKLEAEAGRSILAKPRSSFTNPTQPHLCSTPACHLPANPQSIHGLLAVLLHGQASCRAGQGRL